MTTSQRPAASKPTKKKKKRKTRKRPTPRRLQSDPQDLAQRRCLMILSVLSGEKSVAEIIEEAKITRTYYYHLEKRALDAMLKAMLPGTPGKSPSTASKIQELEAQIEQLQKDKRRSERLLFLTRKVVQSGSMKSRTGRRKKKSSKPSKPSGSSRSTTTKGGKTTP